MTDSTSVTVDGPHILICTLAGDVPHRRYLAPGSFVGGEWTETDLSSEPQAVKDAAAEAWTGPVVDAYRTQISAESALGQPSPREAVNRERYRRIATLFSFGGVAYQLDPASQQNIIAKGAQAKFAVMNGAAAGDLRWANTAADFGWIATDNSITPMDAPTMSAFADAADLWVSAHIMAAHAIKALDPIPADFDANSRWPTVI